jgi:excisionase family DNA binding protein
VNRQGGKLAPAEILSELIADLNSSHAKELVARRRSTDYLSAKRCAESELLACLLLSGRRAETRVVLFRPARCAHRPSHSPEVRDTRGMTPNQFRLILADALDGAADRLRTGIGPDAEPERTAANPLLSDPLPGVTQHVLRAEDVAQLLDLSRWKVYEAIRLGEIPSIRVGRRLLIPTHALRKWLSESTSAPLVRGTP